MSNSSILVVEDRPDWREELREILQPLGGVVDVAATYEDALHYVKKEKYDLITVDLALRGNPSNPRDADQLGTDLLQVVRESQYNKDSGLIVLTGYSSLLPTNKAHLDYGVYDYIEKDKFNTQSFVKTARTAIREVQQSRAEAKAGADDYTGDPKLIEGKDQVRLRIPERIVRTGFASEKDASVPLDVTMSLGCKQLYYFWLEIGALAMDSIEETPTAAAEHLPSKAQFTVVLFTSLNEIQVTSGADVGTLEIQGDKLALVIHQPMHPPSLSPNSKLLTHRLFFPVRTPDKAGTFHLRCNIYYEQILIQSRLIYVRVMRTPQPVDRAFYSAVDYTLSRTFDPTFLSHPTPHRLSLMLNSNGDGTHSFRFFGADGSEVVKGDASFDGHELEKLIQRARGALRRASWGDEAPWQRGKAYRYAGPFSPERLKNDLMFFAIRGYRFYDAIINRLADRSDKVGNLAGLMRTPGMVQIALKESPRFIFPAALIYDYDFDTNAYDDLSKYALCPDFVNAFNGSAPFEELGCFQGNCPSRGLASTICPSGFWGYRHYVGVPLSVMTGRDMPLEIVYQQNLQLAVAVSTDPDLRERIAHEKALQSLRPGSRWSYADTRERTLTLLKETQPHLVYFYCHGGVANDVPYIQVGPTNEPVITRDNLRYKEIHWDDSRPLVFINGCNTAALEPEVALEFVSAFVENASASGVIGTEITIFEPLACAFAEECLRRFMRGIPIGEAVRGARLKLLKEGNPLGLAYIPYVLSSLSLVEQTTSSY